MDQNSEKYFAAACGYVWKPLEQIGILDPTSAAKNYAVKQRTEKKLAEWNDEAIDALEFAQVALEEAEIEAEIAKAALDAAQARYEQVLAAISEE